MLPVSTKRTVTLTFVLEISFLPQFLPVKRNAIWASSFLMCPRPFQNRTETITANNKTEGAESSIAILLSSLKQDVDFMAKTIVLGEVWTYSSCFRYGMHIFTRLVLFDENFSYDHLPLRVLSQWMASSYRHRNTRKSSYQMQCRWTYQEASYLQNLTGSKWPAKLMTPIDSCYEKKKNINRPQIHRARE